MTIFFITIAVLSLILLAARKSEDFELPAPPRVWGFGPLFLLGGDVVLVALLLAFGVFLIWWSLTRTEPVKGAPSWKDLDKMALLALPVESSMLYVLCLAGLLSLLLWIALCWRSDLKDRLRTARSGDLRPSKKEVRGQGAFFEEGFSDRLEARRRSRILAHQVRQLGKQEETAQMATLSQEAKALLGQPLYQSKRDWSEIDRLRESAEGTCRSCGQERPLGRDGTCSGCTAN